MRKIEFVFWHKLRREMWLVQFIDWQQNEVCNGGDIAKLNDGELMQNTGLKDRNGKEIFEGYILNKVKKNGECYAKKYLVSWDKDNAKFTNLEYNNEKIVIGNIWESPELLNK